MLQPVVRSLSASLSSGLDLQACCPVCTCMPPNASLSLRLCPAGARCYSHAGRVLQALAERIADSDQAVRAALRGLLREGVLLLLDATAVAPFMPLVMAHLCGCVHVAGAVTGTRARVGCGGCMGWPSRLGFTV